ncbi:MAG: surface lipoprotein assembly modifier [Deltaproteobacteria bacterium]|jgi:opacity protein-like surface antigen|nr:surface lipoprotein assembly modifier [Deltaproteobacteria bacterium]
MRASGLWFPVMAFLLLLSAFPAFAAADDPARANFVEQCKAEAATLLEKGEADKAYAFYIHLTRLAPEDDAVNLGLAHAATRVKRWNQAVMAYEILLERHPREAGLYGELAHVYMLLGDREAAERCLAVMRSLDGTSRQDTDKALDVLESRYSASQIHGKIRAGIQYDSNANLGPDSNDLSLGNWQVRVDDAKAKSSFGAYLGADLDMGYRAYRDSPWWLVGDVRGFYRGHENDAMSRTHSREAHWGRAAVGVRRLESSTLAEVRLKGEVFDYEFYQNVSAWGPEGTFLWAALPSFHLIFKGNIEKRDYSRDHRRNGVHASLGAYGRVFFGADKHELLVGGRRIDADAKEKSYRHDGWEGMVRLLFKLPYGFEIAPFASFTREFYKGPATILESENRWDERLRVGLGLTYNINESWALEVGCQYTKNHSNSDLYKYEQYAVNTGIAWSF